MNSRLRRPAVALLATTLAASVLGIAPAAYAADGIVTGVVTGSGAPIAGAQVALYVYDAQGDYWDWTEYTNTDAAGAYSITAPPGQYRIGFADYSGEHVEEYYQNAADVYDAQTITLPDAGSFVADAVLESAAHITGDVSGAGSAALEDVQVTAWRAVPKDGYTDYYYASSAFTGADGSYNVGGLGAGTYRIEFDDYSFGGASAYATEYYNDKPSLYAADDVVVGPAGLVPDIDAVLALDSQVSGRVTDASGAPIEDAWIDALVKIGDEWKYAGYAYSGADGTYVLDGLAAGAYRIEFGASIGPDYATEYWNNVGRLENATDVVLDVDDAAENISAQLVVGEHDLPAVTNTSLPTISGTPVVGQTLTATTGSWTPTPTEYYYDWLRDGQFIPDAYGSTYVPTAEDIGKKITVLVSAGAWPTYDYGYAESAPTAPVGAAPVPPAPVPPAPVPPAPVPPAPVIDVPAGLAAILANLDTRGKPKVGKTVKVTHIDLVLRTAVTYKFQWFTGTKKIKKATKYKLKITKAMKGKKLSVKVTVKAASTSKSIKLKVGKVK